MASLLLSRLTRSLTKYEPLPRYCHISGSVGSKVVVQGGRTKDFSEKSRQQLTSVVVNLHMWSSIGAVSCYHLITEALVPPLIFYLLYPTHHWLGLLSN